MKLVMDVVYGLCLGFGLTIGYALATLLLSRIL
jgi:hypothetical protein